MLAELIVTTLIVTTALVWAGWRLLDQQDALDEQRARGQADAAAEAVAAGIRGKLAEAGERLSGWVSNPSMPVPLIDGAIVAGLRTNGIEVSPAGGLPFVPIEVAAGRRDARFETLEAAEFGGDPQRARAGYLALAGHHDPGVRAGALLRLARTQRQLRDLHGALVSYRRLAHLGGERAADLPAELAGLIGQRSMHLALADAQEADIVAERIRRGLDGGRWLLARGPAELYRETFPEPRPQSWILANALSDVWREGGGTVTPRGQRVFAAAAGGASVLVMWRSNGDASAALAASVDHFFTLPASASTAWQLVDPEGRIIAGRTPASSRSVVRIIGNSEYPWTLHTWVESPAEANRSRAILLTMMAATLSFVWAASYFMAKGIRREAAAARLQSDFVAAVSHEFRSPLTAVRQLAEMLDGERVASDERRHIYYKTLSAEAARLQRLIETLLDFGRIEAGGRYRFSELDAAALVREVVREIAPQARQSGKAIELDGAEDAIPIRADHSALGVALRNLIDNAIKYSPGEPTVRVQCRKDRDRAAICVIDTGVGIPRSEQQAIFRKFVRGRTAIDANIKGTGVGLAVVHQIVAAHGGEVLLHSDPGRGSTFTVLLPAGN